MLDSRTGEPSVDQEQIRLKSNPVLAPFYESEMVGGLTESLSRGYSDGLKGANE